MSKNTKNVDAKAWVEHSLVQLVKLMILCQVDLASNFYNRLVIIYFEVEIWLKIHYFWK